MATSDPQKIEEFLARTRPEQTDGVAVYRRDVGEGSRKPRVTLPPPAIDVEYDGSIIGRYGMVGVSPAIQVVYTFIDRLVASDYSSSIVITGENGTGKELVAKAIHNYGHRRVHPFVSLDCSRFSSVPAESELFGHVRGSFTGAIKNHPGAFVQANKGTIFLDEIGNISLEVQAKLLRALQEKEVRPVGATKPIPFDAHLITATNTDLEDAVKRGEFREDLYYRINVVPILVPTLRDRKEDIPLLIGSFIRKYAQEMERDPIEFSIEALERATCQYLWPGNVRELQNTIERFTVLFNGEISDAELKKYFPEQGYHTREKEDLWLRPQIRDSIRHGKNVPSVLEAIEKSMILAALKECNNNHTQAMEQLGLPHATFYRRLKYYGLK